MATVFEVNTTEEQRSVVSFFVGKRNKVKDIHKDMFPVFGWMCLSGKAVQNWVEKFYKDKEFETEVRKWLRE
jgi:ribulose 1,5-bisphosphate synthetase/thiazole synthase